VKYTPEIRALLRHIRTADEFLRWLREEGDLLIASADLLGGPSWSLRAKAVVHSARCGRDISSYRRSLAALRKLLNLEFVSYLESPEAARFAALNPDDPRADQARLCAEVLARSLRAIEALRLAGVPCVRGAA